VYDPVAYPYGIKLQSPENPRFQAAAGELHDQHSLRVDAGLWWLRKIGAAAWLSMAQQGLRVKPFSD
jgi:hypothetical protein